MVSQSLQRLQFLCDHIPALLMKMDEETFSYKTNPNKWSKKEILGHLIDSATNNHHRFVRGQFEHIPLITYNQDQWNMYNYYQQIATKQLIHFWEAYNRQLLAVLLQLPASYYTQLVNTGAQNCTLAFLVQDYVTHLEHHLKQIISY